MQIRANVAERKLRHSRDNPNSVCSHVHGDANLPNLTYELILRGQGQPSQQQSGGSAEVAMTATVTISAGETSLNGDLPGRGPAGATNDKPDGKDVPVAQGVVLL